MKTRDLLFGMLLLLSAFSGCRDDAQIPHYETSSPSSIYALRRIQTDDNLKFGTTAIRAIVTSDYESKNIEGNIIVVQDLTDDAAILLQLREENDAIKQGDIVRINLEQSTLKYIGGELTVSDLSLNNIKVESSGNNVTPKIVSIATLMTNCKYWGPLLVRLNKINISDNGSTKLSGDLLIDDEIVEIQTRFRDASVFAVETNPLFVESMVDLARINGDEVFLMPRNIADIQVGLTELLEDFEISFSTNDEPKNMKFLTGARLIGGGITAISAADQKNGRQSIRLQGTVGNNNRNGIIALNFDLRGIKTV